MLKKLLASVGIGKATVDTLLLTDQLQAGESFNIEVVIKGGEIEQTLQGLEFAVMASAKTETDLGENEIKYNKSVVLQRWNEAINLTIQPGQTVTKQFSLSLHPEVPATYLFGHSIGKVWLQTGLDIKSGIDASDKDGLTILPSATQIAVLQLISDSGYRLFKSDIESGKVRAREFVSHLPCYQEYEFKPESRSLFGAKELEVTFVDNGRETGVLIEVDRMFLGDGYKSTSIPNHCTTVEEIRPYIARLLS